MLPPSSDPESFFQPSARRLTNLKIRKLLKIWPKSDLLFAPNLLNGLGVKFKGLAFWLRFRIGCLFIKPILEPISTLFSFRGVPLHEIEHFTKDWIQKQELGWHLGWRFIFKSVSLSWTNYFLYIRVQGAQKIPLGKHTRRKGLVLSGLPMSCCLRLTQEERRAFFYKNHKTIIANNETLPLPWGRSANRDRGKAFLLSSAFLTLSHSTKRRAKEPWL